MFTIIFAVIGVLMWVAAGVLVHHRRRQLRKTGLMDRISTSGAADAAKAAPGTPVEVKGTLRCAEPIESEMAGRPCAYHLSRVIREYRETERDASGDLKTRRRSRVVAESERFAPFAVEDGSGAVVVRPEGAEVDAVEVMNRFEGNPGRGRGLTLGGVTVVLGEGEDTIGHRHVESILPIDSPVYVLGYATGDGEIGDAVEGGGDLAKNRATPARSEDRQQRCRRTSVEGDGRPKVPAEPAPTWPCACGYHGGVAFERAREGGAHCALWA